MPQHITAIRDLLLPKLHMLCAEVNKRADLIIDYNTDSILIAIEGKKEQSTLFTRKEIADNTYRADFVPRVRELLKG